MKQHALTAAIFSITLTASSQAVTTFVSTTFDRSSWEAAVSGPITDEGFDTLLSQSDNLTFGSGVTSAATGKTGSPNHLVDFDATTSSNTFNTAINTASSAVGGYLTITWTFPTPVNAFGADFLSIGGSREVGPTGTFDSGTEHYILRDLFSNGDRGFFGVVSTTSFTEITLNATGAIASNDAIRVDNLAFVAVPEPSSSALLGLGGLAFVLRRRK